MKTIDFQKILPCRLHLLFIYNLYKMFADEMHIDQKLFACVFTWIDQIQKTRISALQPAEGRRV